MMFCRACPRHATFNEQENVPTCHASNNYRIIDTTYMWKYGELKLHFFIHPPDDNNKETEERYNKRELHR